VAQPFTGRGSAGYSGDGDLADVDPGRQLVAVQILDHSGQPPFVERHGVLHDEGNILSSGERDTHVACHTMVERSLAYPVDRYTVAPGTPTTLVRLFTSSKSRSSMLVGRIRAWWLPG